MAILSTAKIVGMLASAKKTGKQVLNSAGEWVAEIVEDFVSGFTGHGWKIWEYMKGLWRLEIDSIVVRGTMTVFELLIQKIRAVKGALGITQACGKIKTANLDTGGENWLITIEDEMSFVAHDIIRCQDWTGNGIKGYWVEISEIRKIDGVDTIVVPVSEFTGGIGYVDGMEAVNPDLSGMTTPAEGDEIIQFGNSQNANRQSAIYLHADEGGQPAIDILFGVNSKSFYGCVKMRVGGDIPGADGLKGFYCENGMIKGTDINGHTVYCIHPDGTAEFGDGSAKFSTDKSGFIAGGAISWKWDSAKNKYVCTMKDVLLQWENLSDVPDWISEWDTNKVQIGSTYMISPKLFTGKNTGTAEKPVLTGIVQGDKCITIDGVERSGIFALANNEIIFALDAQDGSGSLAKGTTYWDKFGQTYRKTREIIVWRKLSDEMQAIRDAITNPEDYPDEYDLDPEYGTYLITHSLNLDFYVNLPDPTECPGLIIDVYDMPRTRALIYWAKLRCKISPILKANAAGVYEPVVVDDPGRMKFGSSAIRSEKYNDVYRWIADSDFVTVNV